MRRLAVVGCFLVLGCSGRVGESDDDDDDDDDTVGAFDARPADSDGGGVAPDASSPDARPTHFADPGSACGCDGDCKPVEGHDGVCVFGVCMLQASGACASGGSQGECPDGSRCWGIAGAAGFLCWPDCESYACDGVCDDDDSCAYAETTACQYGCGSYCACLDGECSPGQMCAGGTCVPTDEPPAAGPGPDCPDLPTRDCSSGCGTLVQMDPHYTPHYDDYPENGETETDQYRSWMRRDLSMLLDYATAKTLCKTAGWDTGIGGPLGFGDASEADGSIPGTSIGFPAHPSGSHVNGRDIDIAYYQIDMPDNHLRAICEHVDWGEDEKRCVGEPTHLDVWRTAMYLGALFESDRIRVIGIDGKVGPYVVGAINELCDLGWIEDYACDNVNLAYEVTDTGLGWFKFHHHHNHVSLKSTSAAPPAPRVMPCRVEGCNAPAVKPNPLWPRARSW